jgi:peptidoglycan L-alanyl-D-glutamate endopeptidase CwlK
MGFVLGKNSLARLATVDPRMQAVVKRAIQISPVDFTVTQGNRTRDEQARLYGKGRTASQMSAKGLPTAYAKPGEKQVTWTMNSNHIGGRAVDLAPYANGRIEWDENGKLGYWPKIAAAMRQAARELNVPIKWGGDWEGTPDRPHFELVK